jgi:tol-pal system protein YbgF
MPGNEVHLIATRQAALALVVAWLVALPARAALFDDDEARRRIEAANQRISQIQRQLEERMTALEGQLKSQGLVELFGQLEQMRAEVSRLRGQIEVLTYEQDQQQKRQRDLYIDLDSRLRKIEGAAVGAPPSAPAPSGALPPGAPSGSLPPVAPPVASASAPAPAAPAAVTSEQRAYDAALDQFKGGSYPAAIASFAAFVKTYPKSPLAPSAQFWIGSAQFAQREYRASIASQRQLVAAYPDSAKVPDALLSIATAQFEMGDSATSRRTLEDLIKRYPQSESAAKARQRLAIR